MDNDTVLHVVMFPWLAIGHLLPFLELSQYLAQKGHRVSFVSTPRNIQRLPKISPDLSPLISLVNLPLPHVDNLPHNAEASTDVPIQKSQLLKKAFDGLDQLFSTFLENSPPDWIIYDYAHHWLPALAAKLGVPCAFFSLFNAASLAFFGPPWALLSDGEARMTPEDLTAAPKWIPFPSDVAYRLHEVQPLLEAAGEIASGVSDFYRFGLTIRDCKFVALRSCLEFEPDWINLLEELYQKPIIPVGFLHPSVHDLENEGDEKWVVIREWLDKQKRGSVVYVAFGSEATLSQEQVNELALGLEQSEFPFFWVLRKPPGSAEDESVILPEGFEDRTRGRGIVYMSWAPQVRILAHPAVGCFVTHCGWNSVIEGLGFGCALILLPLINEQGLNARLLEGKNLGLEIPRNEGNGSFTSESVAKSLRVVMVEKEGEVLRNNAKVMREVFGDKNRNDRYVCEFVKYLEEHRRRDRTSTST